MAEQDEEFEYQEKQFKDKSFESSLKRILHGNKDAINVQYAAKIISLNSQDSVNIEYYRNGVTDILYNVPVKHHKTSSGFFIIKLKVGDKGVVRFFDDDIELYRTSGVISESSEVKVHDLNDNLFEIGFYPDTENYTYPDGDLVIGTTAGALISLTGNSINISGGNINISGSEVNLGGLGGAYVLTENSTITDGEGSTCTITSNTTKTKAI